MKIRSITVLLLLGMVMINTNPLFAQSSDTPMPQVLKEWEDHYDIILNYDYQSLSGYNFSGKLSYESARLDLEMILRGTPYEFSSGEQIFSIYKANKRDYMLCGTILSPSGEHLAYANILLSSQETGTLSDSVGTFVISIKGVKNDKVTISYLGYVTKELYLSDLFGDCQMVVLEINDQLVLQNVIIKDYLYSGVSLSADHSAVVFDYQQITQDNSSNEHDVLMTLQLLPGVSSTDESATNLNIRGSTPDQNLILWENSTLYDPGHLFGMISSINPYLVDEVKLYKGVFNPKYDNRIGGLIDISLPGVTGEEITGSFGASMTEAHGTLAVPIISNKMGLFVGGRHNLSGIIETPTFSNYVNRVFQNTKIETDRPEVSEGIINATDELNYYDLNLKWIYKPSDRVSFSASTLMTGNSFNYSSDFIEENERSMDVLDYSSSALSLRGDFRWSNRLASSLYYNSSDYANTYRTEFVDSNRDLLVFSSDNFNDIADRIITLDNSLELNKTMSLNFGFIRDHKTVNFSLLEVKEFELDYEVSFGQEQRFSHLYTAFNLTNSQHILDLSIKASKADESLSSWIFSPRAAYRHVITPQWQAKVSAGRVYQFISQVRDLGITDINSGTNFWALTELGEEDWLYADKYSMGMVYTSKGWLIDVDAYHNRTNNLKVFNNNALDLINIENAIGLTSTGIELLVKKQWDDYGFWFNYTLSDNKYQGDDFPQSTPSEIDQLHKLSVTNSIDINDFNINLTYQFKSGLPLSEPTDIITLDGVDAGYYDIAYRNGVNQGQLNDYSRLDLSFSWTKRLNSLRLQSSLSLINILNRENIAARSFLVGDDEDEFGQLQPVLFSLEKRLLGFTPRVMFRVSF